MNWIDGVIVGDELNDDRTTPNETMLHSLPF